MVDVVFSKWNIMKNAGTHPTLIGLVPQRRSVHHGSPTDNLRVFGMRRRRIRCATAATIAERRKQKIRSGQLGFCNVRTTANTIGIVMSTPSHGSIHSSSSCTRRRLLSPAGRRSSENGTVDAARSLFSSRNKDQRRDRQEHEQQPRARTSTSSLKGNPVRNATCR